MQPILLTDSGKMVVYTKGMYRLGASHLWGRQGTLKNVENNKIEVLGGRQDKS